MAEFMMPPASGGKTEAQQINEMRDFLVRTVRQLNTAAASVDNGKVVTTTVNRASVEKATGSRTASQMTETEQQLKSLIIKTADTVRKEIVDLGDYVDATYVAESDFGTYEESTNTRITNTEHGIDEAYDRISALKTSQNAYITKINGEIRRGYITDPQNRTYFGIAIGSHLEFTGVEMTGTDTPDGETYAELVTSQSLGLYTSEGWFFFLDGVPAGYFDASNNGEMHINYAIIDTNITIGQYLISSTGNWGIRWVGGNG